MRKRPKKFMLIVMGIAVLGIVAAMLIGATTSKQEKVVEKFYELEQEGDFGSSWERFHSQMKKRMNKDQYIQSRAHVFMQDMNAKEFTFKLGKMKQLDKWKGAKTDSELKKVYKIPVYQTYTNSKFGKFTIEQNCFVAKEKDEWKILWDYSGE